MARSFYNTTSPTALYLGSTTFSGLIATGFADYGLTSGQATAYAALDAEYAAAYLVAQAPETRTKSNIRARSDLAIPLKQMASELAHIIDSHPGVTNQQRIDLGLAPHKVPAPVPPPGTPSDLVATLDGNGAINLKWKCANPPGSQGTIYQVYRQVNGDGEFDYVGGEGSRKHTDNSVPAGATMLTYRIQAVRSTAVGGWAEFTVRFGTSAGGGMTATVESAPTLAA